MNSPIDRTSNRDWVSVGEMIAGRYLIERMLGEGGMGVVYAARHVLLERDVAVKFLSPALADDATVVERFLREARTSVKLRHRSVVEVLDCGADRDRIFLVMEFLQGETLQALMEREGALAPRRALGFLMPVLDALSFVHARGYLHRDIKPDNVFLAREGEDGPVTPKILDFGITRCVDDSRVRLTLPGGTLGTPAYMAPEQARGTKDLTPAVDQFAAAVVLYEMLSAELPHPHARSIAQAIAMRATQPPVALDAVRDDLPPALVAAVMRALSIDPQNRFPTIDAFREALLPFAGAAVSPASATPTAPVLVASEARPASARRPLAWVAGVSFAVFAVVFGAGLAFRPRVAPPAAPRVEPRTAPPPAPPATPAVETVEFTVDITPADARITLDGEALGSGHVRATRPRDGRSYTLVASAPGYASFTRTVTAESNALITSTLAPLHDAGAAHEHHAGHHHHNHAAPEPAVDDLRTR